MIDFHSFSSQQDYRLPPIGYRAKNLLSYSEKDGWKLKQISGVFACFLERIAHFFGFRQDTYLKNIVKQLNKEISFIPLDRQIPEDLSGSKIKESLRDVSCLAMDHLGLVERSQKQALYFVMRTVEFIRFGRSQGTQKRIFLLQRRTEDDQALLVRVKLTKSSSRNISDVLLLPKEEIDRVNLNVLEGRHVIKDSPDSTVNYSKASYSIHRKINKGLFFKCEEKLEEIRQNLPVVEEDQL